LFGGIPGKSGESDTDFQRWRREARMRKEFGDLIGTTVKSSSSWTPGEWPTMYHNIFASTTQYEQLVMRVRNPEELALLTRAMSNALYW
jgi:hypothetical protein